MIALLSPKSRLAARAQVIGGASRIHHAVLHRVLHAPKSFYDTTPLGLLINVFSKDLDTLDECACRLSLPHSSPPPSIDAAPCFDIVSRMPTRPARARTCPNDPLHATLVSTPPFCRRHPRHCSFSPTRHPRSRHPRSRHPPGARLLPLALISFFKCFTIVSTALLVAAVAAPIALAALPLVWVTFRRLTTYFQLTATQLKRLDKASSGPLFSLYAESLAGLTSIRAFGLQQPLGRRLLHRLQVSARQVHRHSRARYEGHPSAQIVAPSADFAHRDQPP